MEFASKFFDTAGVGLFVVGGIVTFLLTAYGLTALWIMRGSSEGEKPSGS